MTFPSILRREDGIALVMVIGMLAVIASVGTFLAYYSSANVRSSSTSRSGELAYSLAESGVARGLSRLVYGDPTNFLLLWSTTTEQGEGGSYSYYGRLSGRVWTITSTGLVANPTGPTAADIERTLTRKVTVEATNTGSFGEEWDRIYHDDASSCFTVPVVIPSSVSAANDLCITGAGGITGASSKVSVGDDITLTGTAMTSQRPPGTGVGSWTTPANIVSSNNQTASVAVTGGSNSPTIDATTFGFAIPADAQITGVTARVERRASSSSNMRDQTIQLLKAGVPIGSNKAVTGTNWTTSDSMRTYGASSDLWGTTWTPAEINAGNFGLRIITRNVAGSGSITSYVDFVDITVNYTTAPGAIGSSGTPVDQVDVPGTCRANTYPANSPCGSADFVWGDPASTANTVKAKPTASWTFWWWNAELGPKHACDEVVGTPPAFDSNGNWSWWPDGSSAAQELTPEGADYQCRAKDAQGNITAELSWNRSSRVLTVKGSIFFDGDARFDDNIATPVHYQGRASMWVAENWRTDEAVCAGGTGSSSNCRTTGMSSWDPSQNLLTIYAGGVESSGNDDIILAQTYSAFQGMLFAENDCRFENSPHVSAPVICDRVEIPGTPSFFDWPALPGVVTNQMYQSGTARDHQLVLGSQRG